MTTVRDLIQGACRKIGALAAGEALDAAAAQDHLQTLNQMLADWNQKDLLVYTLNRNTFALTPGQQTYTIGTGGNFNMARPAKIDMASVLVNTGSNPLEIPLHICTDEEWQGVPIKNIGSTWPTAVWMQGNMPLNNLTFWPLPSAPCSVILYCWERTLAFTSINDEFVFPDGYERAIVYNLAIEISSEYERDPRASVVEIARDTLRSIAQANWEIPISTPNYGVGVNRTLALQSRGYVMP